MFSKPRLFFLENQKFRYTASGKLWFELYYEFNSIFKQQVFPNMKLTKNE